MTTRSLVTAFAFVFALFPAPAISADAVAAGNGGNVALGKNWGPYETYAGASFRWVANDAEIVVHGNGLAHLTIACEGGPSLGAAVFPLRVLDAGGHQVDHAQCAGRGHTVALLFPVQNVGRYVLHADGGGRPVAGERRILNFRVFSLDGGGNAGGGGGDITTAQNGVRLGDHWGAIERYANQTFRWVDGNDAQVFVAASRDLDTRVRILAETGPSVGAPSTVVAVRDGGGKTVYSGTVRGVVALNFPAHLHNGENLFTVHVAQTKNVRVPHDARLLNLRVFSVAALR